MIPHNQPLYGEAEMFAAQKVIATSYLAAGPECDTLERIWASTVGAEQAATVSSGLSALRLALLALGIKPGAEVIISAYNCVALHNAIKTIGAVPVLAEINRDTLCLDAEAAISKVTPKTRAIISVHMFGNEAEIKSLMGLGIPVIEDMCHTLVKQTADIAISSFYPTKLIGGIGGGIVSGRESLIRVVKDLRSYGNKEPSMRQNDLFNDVGAAITISKMKKHQFESDLKVTVGKHYNELLKDYERPNAELPYRYTVRLEGHNVTDVTTAMQEKGVCSMAPVTDYRPWMDFPPGLPSVCEAFRSIVSLPFYPTITREEQYTVAAVLGECTGGG